MANKKTPVTLMLPIEEELQALPSTDRGGGQTHGWFTSKASKVVATTVDPEKIKQNFDKSLEQTKNLLKDAAKKIAEGWEIDSITISFALNGEGSIGIVTVGVEAGIEVTLKPVAKKKR